MKFTDVRIRLISSENNKLKAVAIVTIDDCFVVRDIRVIEGNQGYFVAMPNRKTADGNYVDIAHPISTQTREELNRVVLEAYEKAKNEQNN